jgi:hypothetical protein
MVRAAADPGEEVGPSSTGGTLVTVVETKVETKGIEPSTPPRKLDRERSGPSG